jgi:hypothetical protein
MSDLRWKEIEADVASAVRHFVTAEQYYGEPDLREDTYEGHKTRMAFMHSMQAGHTSLETALIRILALVDEPRPTGEFWHTDLIRRAGVPRRADRRSFLLRWLMRPIERGGFAMSPFVRTMHSISTRPSPR